MYNCQNNILKMSNRKYNYINSYVRYIKTGYKYIGIFKCSEDVSRLVMIAGLNIARDDALEKFFILRHGISVAKYRRDDMDERLNYLINEMS